MFLPIVKSGLVFRANRYYAYTRNGDNTIRVCIALSQDSIEFTIRRGNDHRTLKSIVISDSDNGIGETVSLILSREFPGIEFTQSNAREFYSLD